MRISDWSSDVCSSDLSTSRVLPQPARQDRERQARLRTDLLSCEQSFWFSPFEDSSLETAHRQLRTTLQPVVGGIGAGSVDRKSTRLTPVTNAHLVCRLLLEKKNRPPLSTSRQYTNITTHT